MTPNHRLTIFQMNDTHGYVEPHRELVWRGATPSYPVLGGYARIKTLLDDARRGNPGGVLALDNGDTFHGTYLAVSSKGLALVPLVNSLGLDAMTAHWEFAWGPRHFMDLARSLAHPVLAANCFAKESGERPFPGTMVVERAGLRIGVVGLAATIIDKSMPPHFSTGLRFTDGVKETDEAVGQLRGKDLVDLVVVLSHLGFPQDMELAKEVRGIDVLLSGHTHNRLEHPALVRDTILIQSGCHGSFIGLLDLDVRGGRVVSYRHRLIEVNDGIQGDPGMDSLVDEVMSPHRSMLGETVGRTDIGLHRGTTLCAPMDDLLLAAVADAADTAIAFSNGWRYGAPVPPGRVTMNDLWNMVPTNPPVSTADLTGAEITEMLEENVERTFSGKPFRQMGGYLKRFRGLTIYGKLENPAGSRIERVFAMDDPLDASQTYRVAFITAQGVPERFGKNRRDLPIGAVAALRTYLQAGKKPGPETLGRFVAV